MPIKSKCANNFRSNVWTDSIEIPPILCGDLSLWMRSLHARNETAVQTVGGSAPKKVDRICRKGYGQRVLWCERDPVNWLPWKGRTIIGEHYSQLFWPARCENSQEGWLEEKKIFYQDNALPHKGALAMVKLRDLGYELDRPPILLIWHPQTTICFQTWRKMFLVSASHRGVYSLRLHGRAHSPHKFQRIKS